MFKASGKITYSPQRNVDSKWWLTVEMKSFNDTARYYRWLLDRYWWKGDTYPIKRRYVKPPHPYHISIIRGEKPRKNLDQWGLYKAGQNVAVYYESNLRQVDKIKDGRDDLWFLDVHFREYLDIRSYFGLQTERDGKPFKGHITICNGYT